MSVRLFVGNLPYSASSEDLRQGFSEFGFSLVDAIVISDRDTGRSRGFGFITVETREEADRVLDEVNERDFGGRSIRINEADDKPQRRPQQARPQQRRGGYEDGPIAPPREKRGGRRTKGRSRRRRDDDWPSDTW